MKTESRFDKIGDLQFILVIITLVVMIGNEINTKIIPTLLGLILGFVVLYHLIDYFVDITRLEIFTLALTILFTEVIIIGLIHLLFTNNLYFQLLESNLYFINLLIAIFLFIRTKNGSKITGINIKNKFEQLINDIRNERELKLMLIILSLTIIVYFNELRNPVYLPSKFGLWDKLSIFYYLGFSTILIVSSYSVINKFPKWILIVETLILLLYTHFLSISVTQTYSIHTSLQFFGHMQYIIKHHALSPLFLRERLWYHAWPGFFIFTGFLVHEFEVSTQLFIIGVWPILFRLLSTIYLYQLSLKFHDDKNSYDFSFLFIFLFLLTDWLYQDYFAPQSLALLFMFQILILLFSIDFTNYINKRNIVFAISILLIYITLFRTHLLTSLFTIALVGLYLIFKLFEEMNNSQLNKDRLILIYQNYQQQILISVIILFSVFVILLYIFINSWWFQNKGLYFLSFIYDFDFRALNRLIDSIGGVTERIFTVTIRLLLSAIVGILWVVSLISLYRYRDTLTNDNRRLLMFNKITVIVLSIFTSILVFIYSDELFHRMYLYSLPIMLLAITSFIRKINHRKQKMAITIFLVLLFGLMFLPAKFGNERVNLIYEGELEAVEFINNNYNGTPVISYQQMMASSFCYECHDVYELERDFKPNYAEWDTQLQQYIHIIKNEEIEISSDFNSSHLVLLTKSYKLRSSQFDLVNEEKYDTIIHHVSNSPNYILLYEKDGTVVYLLDK